MAFCSQISSQESSMIKPNFSRESLLTGNGTYLDMYYVQRNDAAFFESEMICTGNCGFGEESKGKGDCRCVVNDVVV